MTAYYIHDLSPFVFQFGDGLGLRWYGLSYVAAFLTGYFLYKILSRRGYADLPEKDVGDFMTWWVVFGTLIGGRLGYMVFYQWDSFLANPLDFFKVWEGGMSAHGGMLGLVIATFLYARTHRISWLNLGDNLVVVAPLGIFFGRCANFINGELYGRATTVPWAVQFPKELFSDPGMAQTAVSKSAPLFGTIPDVSSIIASVSSSGQVREILAEILTPRHPSQIYQALLEGLVLFAVLWLFRTRLRLPNGTLTGLFFLIYAVLRSFSELFREPDSELVGMLTRGQFLSIFLFLIGIAFLLAARFRPTYPKAFGKSPSRRSA